MNYLCKRGVEKIYESRGQLRIDDGKLYYGKEFIIANGEPAFLIECKVGLMEYVSRFCFNQYDNYITVFMLNGDFYIKGTRYVFGVSKESLPYHVVRASKK